jgi:two-component system sensor histidine kinase/response regulator
MTSPDLLLALADYAPVAIYHADRSGHLTYANPQYRTMFSLDAGQSLDDWAKAIHADDRLRIESLWVGFFAQRSQSMRFEYAAVSAAGERRHLCEHVVAIGAVGVEGFVGTITDVTELKNAQVEMERLRSAAEAASRAKSEFLANMSHEIRTPLNGVIGMTRLLLDTPQREDQREYTEIARSCGESLLAVLNDVLDFSKIEAGEMVLEQIDLDVSTLVRQSVDAVALRAGEKGLELVVDVDPAVPMTLRGDPTRLRQVMLNLLSNAVKFTDQGTVRIGVRQLPGGPDIRLRFEVTDTGVGLSHEQRSRLFSPFVQADATTTRRFGGTGLGLSICRRLIDLMGGCIDVESAPGMGSCFWFEVSLPKVFSSMPESTDRVHRPVRRGDDRRDYRPVLPQVSLQGRRILLAEDNEVNQKITRRVLERVGATVAVVDTGQAAIEYLVSSSVDAVLMDCQMPVLDGYEATRRIRQGAAGPQAAGLPIIAVTAHALTGDRERCLAAGMSDYLTKPINPAAVLASLAALLGPREADLPTRPGRPSANRA